MDTLKLFSYLIIFFLSLSCKDEKIIRDDCNFRYIIISDYPFKTDSIPVKMITYKKDSTSIISQYNDFSTSFFDITEKSKGLNIKLNFENNSLLNNIDFKIIIDNKYSFLFKEVKTKLDTFKKPKILGDDIYIYKTLNARVNDSLMKFEEFNMHSDKDITLPFSLAKNLINTIN